MIRRIQLTMLMLLIGVWAMASYTSVKNADGVEIWYDFDSSAKTASVTYKGELYYTYNDEYIGNVVIPSKVTYDGEEYSVTTIGYNAFYDCSGLTSVTIPESVTSIGWSAFFGCSSLTSITLPESVTEIAYRAFFRCSSLTSITLPEGLTKIGEDAFFGCSSLTNITMPEGVTEIRSSAFSGCSSLTSIDVVLDNNSYTSIDGVLFSKDKTILIKYPEGKKDVTSYAIPESVTEIGDYAFSGCSFLTSITIPENVTKIGDYAFSGCSSLTSITIPEGVTSIGDGAFEGCSGLTSVTIPEGVTEIGGSAFRDCSGLTSVTIPASVTEIGDRAFSGCRSLTSITLPEGVTKIGSSAFSGCSSLTSITIPESVTEIGERAFSGCGSLTSITIPESVTEIGDYAFYDCSSLTSITIPESVTEIGKNAFFRCSSLTSITIPKGVTSIGGGAFSGCYILYEVFNKSNLAITAESSENGAVAYYAKNVYTDDSGESKLHTVGDYIFYVDEDNIELLAYIGDKIAITLPSDYEGKDYIIANYAFRSCSSLTSITIPKGVTEIGRSAFSYCEFLTSIMLPESVTSIGDYAFLDCSSLTSITIPKSVTEIGYYAFLDCSSLTSIDVASNNNNYTSINGVLFSKDKTIIIKYPEGKDATSYIIPESVTGIYSYAFSNCSKLTSITLPESVRSIGYYAFLDCSSLTSITIPKSVTEIGSDAFSGCSSLTSITLPESVTKIRFRAFEDCSSLTSITSMNATPPSIYGECTFNKVDKSIPVYVPKQSVEAYKSAEYWKDFTNIVGKFLVVTATAENGTVTGAGVYEENEEVTLIATPDEGYKFVKWEDGETNATRKITVTEDVTLTAVFESNSSVTPVTDVVADSVSIRLIGNSLIVEGAENYAVYALSGQCLGKVESLERGVYIVVADGVSKRIVVK